MPPKSPRKVLFPTTQSVTDQKKIKEAVKEVIKESEGAQPHEKYLLNHFLKFIESFPEERQRAVELWLVGCSYREISETLSNEGIEVTHVTVGSWLRAALKAFRENLDTHTPKQKKQQRHSTA
jgi:DNA-directed RNA polymerase specialized sigma24 family protein